MATFSCGVVSLVAFSGLPVPGSVVLSGSCLVRHSGRFSQPELGGGATSPVIFKLLVFFLCVIYTPDLPLFLKIYIYTTSSIQIN
jgi:hypothetical protein